MLSHAREETNCQALLKRARHITLGHGQKLRLAILADVATQHLAQLLRVLFADYGVDADVYEGGYDAIELEALNAASQLYTFKPDIVVLLQSVAKIKTRYYEFPGERSSFSSSMADHMERIWGVIQASLPVPILQSTFVLPPERPFGNFSLKVPTSLPRTILELNREICRRAEQHPSVLINDIDQLASWIGRSRFLDEKLWALAKFLCALDYLPDVAQNIVDISLACLGRIVKCVVLDLDNTVWGGVLGDEGIEGIGLGDLDESGAFRSFQSFLRELSRRGILLAVCSKNEERLARQVFREHPAMLLREEDIAVFVANYQDKATNLSFIRERLNIGFDSMVFLDDSPFERNLVRQAIPQIVVPELPEDPALYTRFLSELNLFECASQSSLDVQRTVLYREEQERKEESLKFGHFDEYLQSLKTVAVVQPFEPQTLGRIAQLIQRSNQFNLTTRRYSQAECEAMMRDPEQFHCFSLSVRDRFGDFGLVNVVILRKVAPVLEVDTFLMSCRVLQRGVEQFAMSRIFEFAALHGFTQVRGRYLPTAKNKMVEGFYEKLGFRRIDSLANPGSEWIQDVDRFKPAPVYIQELTAVLNAAPKSI